MNEQAAPLQQIVQKFRPHADRPPIQWLFHTCTVGVELSPMVQACEILLAELGWETLARMAARLHEPTGSPTVAKAFVAHTGGDEVFVERLCGTPSIIFVLDTTPSSLIKTYRQMKKLVWQRHDLGTRMGLLFVSPIDGGRERLISSCQQFLQTRPIDLGMIPSSLVRGRAKFNQTTEVSIDEQVVESCRPLVRRCLSQW